jgi:hypothetical protein
MNEIITPTQQNQQQIQQPQQPPLSIAIQIPPIQIDMTKVVRILFDKIRGLEDRIKVLEQSRTPH